MDEKYPPELTSAETDQLTSTIKDWSLAHGLVVRPHPSQVSAETDSQGLLATPVPVTLFPSPFPRVCFEQAKSVQKAYNQLYAFITQDEDFLTSIAQDQVKDYPNTKGIRALTKLRIVEVDEFIAKLWKVHLQVKEEGYVQNLSLGLFRSDYMVHQESTDAQPVIKQVEFNTIASSFGGLSSQTSRLHKYLSLFDYTLLQPPIPRDVLEFPKNESSKRLASGIRTAFDTYVKMNKPLYKPCIVFIVQHPERNIFDQKHIEYELGSGDDPIPVFRLPFTDIVNRTSIAETQTRQLLYHPPNNPSRIFEVTVVYFRAGYGPGDYADDLAWKARLHLERSNAIKCPTVLCQLAGAKKVQQVLATPTSASTPSILNRFVKGESAQIQDLENTFTNIYPLDESPAGLEARKLATDPEKCKSYVLKPQREGGGNNIYRTAIPPFLQSLPETHWKSYILMEIINPPPVRNTIFRHGAIETGGVICELGIYGTCLWNQATKEILHNEEAGYLLRTKGDKSEEGGVAAGFGSMDSCRLV